MKSIIKDIRKDRRMSFIMYEDYRKCMLCPRECGADRINNIGYCGASGEMYAARAALHFWEEPCISGDRGSGAVFFSGCPLRCVYCQNYNISAGGSGKAVSEQRLTEIFFELKEQGAENINLVTGDHYLPQIISSVAEAKRQDIGLPFIFNCSGYEKTESLKRLEGLIDVYLPDFKYMDSGLAQKYSNAPDYPDTAKKAVAEMMQQQPLKILDSRGMIKHGVIVRHLLLPGHVLDSRKVIRYLFETYGNAVTLSLMNQYTPMSQIKEQYPELDRKVKHSEYERLVDFALGLGVREAYIQEGETQKDSFIPDFNNDGVVKKKED